MTAEVPVAVRRLDPDLPVPAYAHPGDAGADLYAAEGVTLAPGQRALVGTGIAVAIPEGHVGYTNPRSGLAHRLGVTIVNAPGTIDSGYRGEIKINLVNLDPERTAVIERGDRVAQLVVQPVVRARFTEVDEFAPTARGTGGHGSTGGHRRLAEESERV
ncbi:dUTP diphosphatase [Glycomyces mayteni]|uniref:Deoxyuridine 5'-triphosphate nucleotidohydrolase n=1 Tax=Glycomyces mayteni TaxID=543887 RepID=A0ABW2D2H1_9ACTN|nr:dUTP diphosphatase [Glycomyces mayteni]